MASGEGPINQDGRDINERGERCDKVINDDICENFRLNLLKSSLCAFEKYPFDCKELRLPIH